MLSLPLLHAFSDELEKIADGETTNELGLPQKKDVPSRDIASPRQGHWRQSMGGPVTATAYDTGSDRIRGPRVTLGDVGPVSVIGMDY